MGLFSEMMDEASDQAARIAELETENARLCLLAESWKATAEAEAEIGNERAAENTQLREANKALSAMLKPAE